MELIKCYRLLSPDSGLPKPSSTASDPPKTTHVTQLVKDKFKEYSLQNPLFTQHSPMMRELGRHISASQDDASSDEESLSQSRIEQISSCVLGVNLNVNELEDFIISNEAGLFDYLKTKIDKVELSEQMVIVLFGHMVLGHVSTNLEQYMSSAPFIKATLPYLLTLPRERLHSIGTIVNSTALIHLGNMPMTVRSLLKSFIVDGKMSSEDMVRVISAIEPLLQEQTLDVIEKAMPLLKMGGAECIGKIITAIVAIPQTARTDVITTVLSLFDHVDHPKGADESQSEESMASYDSDSEEMSSIKSETNTIVDIISGMSMLNQDQRKALATSDTNEKFSFSTLKSAINEVIDEDIKEIIPKIVMCPSIVVVINKLKVERPFNYLEIIRSMKPIFTKDLSRLSVIELLECVARIPQGQPQKIMEQAQCLFNQIDPQSIGEIMTEAFQLYKIFRILIDIQEDRRDDIIKEFNILVNDRKIDLRIIEELCKKLKEIMETHNEINQKSEFRDIITNTKSILDIIWTDKKTRLPYHILIQTISAVAEIPQGSRIDIVKGLQNLINGQYISITLFDYIPIVHSLIKMRSSDPAHYLSNTKFVKDLLDTEWEGQDKGVWLKCVLDIIAALVAIPPGERADVILKVKSLAKTIASCDIARTLRDIAAMPQGIRSEMIGDIQKLLGEQPSKGIYCREFIDVLYGIKTCTPEKYTDILTKATPLLNQLWRGKNATNSAYYAQDVIRLMAELSPEERRQWSEALTERLTGLINDDQLIKNIESSIERLHREIISKLVRNLGGGDEYIVIRNMKLINRLKAKNPYQYLNIIRWLNHPVLKITGAKSLSKALENTQFIKFSQLKNIDKAFRLFISTRLPYTVIDLVGQMQIDEQLEFPDSIHGLQELLITTLDLDSVQVDRQRSANLAETIIKLREELNLSDDNPLFQKAINVLVLADPDVLNDLKNPYNIFQSLQAFLDEPYFQLSAFNVLELDMRRIREMAQTLDYTVQMLPHDVTRENIERLFGNMVTRFEALSEDEQTAVGESVRSLLGVEEQGSNFSNKVLNIPSLQDEFFRADGLISKWLSHAPVGGGRIDSSHFKAFMILKSILDVNESIVDSVKLLTPQECLIVNFINCVINCSTGQKNGIEVLYKELPKIYQVSGNSDDQVVNEIVRTTVQRSLNEAIQEQVRVVVGGIDPQEVHQILYVKNRLFRQLGLEHKLEFDLHTGVLSEAVLDYNPQQMFLGIVEKFQQILPRKILENINDMIKRDPKQTEGASSYYVLFSEIFEHHKREIEDCVEFDANYKLTGLTPLGALTLLQEVGVVKDDSSEA